VYKCKKQQYRQFKQFKQFDKYKQLKQQLVIRIWLNIPQVTYKYQL